MDKYGINLDYANRRRHNMLEINNLNVKIQDRYLIKNLSLKLGIGDKLAIIGEEGNGKSTLLKCIIGKLLNIQHDLI